MCRALQRKQARKKESKNTSTQASKNETWAHQLSPFETKKTIKASGRASTQGKGMKGKGREAHISDAVNFPLVFNREGKQARSANKHASKQDRQTTRRKECEQLRHIARTNERV